MREVKNKIGKQKVLLSIIMVGILLVMVGLFYSSFSLLEPVRSIRFTSEKLNYDEKTPGSWKVEKSAEWIDKGRAKITIDVDTILKQKEDGIDLILVLDTSESMRGEKLEKEKEASINFVEKVLSNSNNRIALIESNSILLDFTSDKDTLIGKINTLESRGTLYYFSALVEIENLLKNRSNDNTRECEVLLIESNYPNNQHPTTIISQNYFKLLKSSYSDTIIHTVQYEQGNEVLELIKRVSDTQYIANTNTLEQVLLNILINSTTYDEFILTEYIDTDNFYIESTSDIEASEGSISFNKEEQRVTWTINSLKSGLKTRMTIDVKLKEELLDVGGTYFTSKKTILHTKLEEDIEDVTNSDTPIIKDNYQVTFEVNAPEGCNVSNITENKNQFVFDKVDISIKPVCNGYQFKGWSILTEVVKRINDDYFIMPSSDVILRAEWSSLKIAKSMNGEIYVGPPSIIRKVEESDTEDIWKYKSEITKVVFENKMDESHIGLEEFDISEEQNGSVMAFYDSYTKTAYIQGNKKIYANADSSWLFFNFTNLKQIEGLEYFDTSNTVNMYGIFANCSNLESLDLSNFNTLKVTNMSWLFSDCKSLINLNISHFDTSSTVDMSGMFNECRSLIVLDLSHFTTSDVINMSNMFSNCRSLTSLNVSGFNTLKVTNMFSMFDNCYNLEKIDVSSFDTSNVTDMSRMFSRCENLMELDVSSFNTSKVTNMSHMFLMETKMTRLILGNNFDTSNVTNMSYMFAECSSLTNIDLGEKFDTSNVTDMSFLFNTCTNLRILNIGSKFNLSNVVNMEAIFRGCKYLTTTITITNPNTSTYNYMFLNTSINGGQVTVNYTKETSDLVDKMIETKSFNSNLGIYSNVVKGVQVTI